MKRRICFGLLAFGFWGYSVAQTYYFDAEKKSPGASKPAEAARQAVRKADAPGKQPKPAAPSYAPLSVFRDKLSDGNLGPEMVVLPKGEFLMGSPEGEPRRDSSELQHRVKINYGLAVGKYEVSQREWQAVMGSNPSHFKGEDLPVEQVSWEDAQAYIRKLNKLTGNKYGYRLLSEAEWEYAARAGTITPFSTGQTISTAQANFNGKYTYNGSREGEDRQKTTRVGSFVANAWGLHDMHGNVWEWVEDCWHENFNGAPEDGSAWVSNCDGAQHAVRGGSWRNDPWILRSAIRLASGNENYVKGFRLARKL